MGTIRSIIRGWPLLLIALALMAWVIAQEPQKLGNLGYGVAKMAAGGYSGYWLDRAIFPYARPDRVQGVVQGTAFKRRAWIVCACVLASSLIP